MYALAILIAACSYAAAAIHATVLPDHSAEMWQHGLFMACATGGQLLSALLWMFRRKPRWVWWATLAGNVLVLAIALWAYTLGLPTWLAGDGVEQWNPQVVTCDLLEAAILAATAAWIWLSKHPHTGLQG